MRQQGQDYFNTCTSQRRTYSTKTTPNLRLEYNTQYISNNALRPRMAVTDFLPSLPPSFRPRFRNRRPRLSSFFVPQRLHLSPPQPRLDRILPDLIGTLDGTTHQPERVRFQSRRRRCHIPLPNFPQFLRITDGAHIPVVELVSGPFLHDCDTETRALHSTLR